MVGPGLGGHFSLTKEGPFIDVLDAMAVGLHRVFLPVGIIGVYASDDPTVMGTVPNPLFTETTWTAKLSAPIQLEATDIDFRFAALRLAHEAGVAIEVPNGLATHVTVQIDAHTPDEAVGALAALQDLTVVKEPSGLYLLTQQ
jgi:hypothetical protein